ncbi:hypothetical protein Riv7116_4539 [Rivularia sp. PCC 7116]|uniref:hypothetical protein n=1 Tax=Rivularia sp. PCC 7116 TaxID=373994 RepID=UPI00029EEA48|nr:hypothetical protein [Rivularia sp. PCC 7116]AFY56959.1 hypothetical protein Riv7116_4539 [Rivularia sp. PCC 7116]
MSTLNSSPSSCRYCEYFTPLGQRGGTCGLLNNGLVKSHWKACSFSNPVFNISNREKTSNYALLNR